MKMGSFSSRAIEVVMENGGKTEGEEEKGYQKSEKHHLSSITNHQSGR